MAASSVCPRCNQHSESLMHCLRDCDFANQVWSLLTGNSLNHTFFSHYSRQWLISNFSIPENWEDNHWPLYFGIALSCSWRSRNELIFSEI